MNVPPQAPPAMVTDQPLTVAEEAAPPIVPPPGEHPAGFETIHDKPAKLWRVGTLVYTTAGLMVLFGWLLFGDFALMIRDRSVGPVVQLMLKGFDANNLTISILLSMVPTSISMLLSPVISYKSDRMRSRYGRRLPFLLVSTPIAAIAMIGLAFCPHIATGLQHLSDDAINRKTALLSTFAIFWTLFEVAAIVANAVFGGLINDVVPRPVIGRFYGMFRAVSLIDGIIFNWFLIGHAEEHFTLIFFWIALVYGVGFTLMCWKVKEGEPPETVVASDHRAVGALGAVKVYFRECFSLPHYRWIFAAMTLSNMAAMPINSWVLLYAKQIGLPMSSWAKEGIGFGTWHFGVGGIISITFIFSLAVAYPMGILVDRFHAVRVTIAAQVLYAVSCLAGYWFIRDPTSLGWAWLAHGVISGLYFTASAALGQVLLPRAKYAQFSSAGGLVTQVILLLYTPLLGAVLDWTNSNYRITFLLSSVFSVLSVALLAVVYSNISKMGGADGYVAPLVDEPRGFDVLPQK